MGKNLGKIIFLNAVGLTIFFSWYLPAEHGFWFTLDKSIFYYFNEQLQPESSFTYFVGLTNVRHFDIISLMAMLALYGYYYSKQDHLGKRKMWLVYRCHDAVFCGNIKSAGAFDSCTAMQSDRIF